MLYLASAFGKAAASDECDRSNKIIAALQEQGMSFTKKKKKTAGNLLELASNGRLRYLYIFWLHGAYNARGVLPFCAAPKSMVFQPFWS